MCVTGTVNTYLAMLVIQPEYLLRRDQSAQLSSTQLVLQMFRISQLPSTLCIGVVRILHLMERVHVVGAGPGCLGTEVP